MYIVHINIASQFKNLYGILNEPRQFITNSKNRQIFASLIALMFYESLWIMNWIHLNNICDHINRRRDIRCLKIFNWILKCLIWTAWRVNVIKRSISNGTYIENDFVIYNLEISLLLQVLSKRNKINFQIFVQLDLRQV